MSAPLAACSPTVVGRMYLVPCLYVNERSREWWMPVDGWVPTVGPKHRDAEHLEFDYEHYHVDWRFIAEASYQSVVGHRPSRSAQGLVITNDTGTGQFIRGIPVLKRRKCRRLMPDFPARPQFVKWERMEQAQAFACNKLKADLSCPHRGIDLKPFVKPDGTVICPGHGIRWDTHTGEMLPHHHAGEAL